MMINAFDTPQYIKDSVIKSILRNVLHVELLFLINDARKILKMSIRKNLPYLRETITNDLRKNL